MEPHLEPENSRHRRNPGRASLNRGIAALLVAAGGNLLGLVIPWAISSGQSSNGGVIGRAVFFPIGGIVSLMLAVLAIAIGVKVRKFVDGLPEERRNRIIHFIDIGKERKMASIGIALGVFSIIVNPLLVFGLITILRPL